MTDKVTAGHALGGHQYNLMYGMFLFPLRHEKIKMLEIGLGCNMHNGVGLSVPLWRASWPLSWSENSATRWIRESWIPPFIATTLSALAPV